MDISKWCVIVGVIMWVSVGLFSCPAEAGEYVPFFPWGEGHSEIMVDDPTILACYETKEAWTDYLTSLSPDPRFVIRCQHDDGSQSIQWFETFPEEHT